MSYQALLFCPDEKTARLVTQVLSELDFSVEASNEPFTAVKRLMAQHFDAVVVDCDNEQNATLLFKSARNSASNQSSLAVAVVEGQAGVAKAFRIGANLVLTKPINVDQAKGTLRVARGLLRKTDTKAPAASTATPAPAAQPATPAATQPRVAPSAPAARPEPAAQKPAFTPAPSRPAAIPTPAPPHFAPAAHAAAAPQEVHESAVLDLPPDLAPAAKSTVVRPAAKEYAWQPVSKPAGPMATAFQQAAAEEEVPTEIEEITDAPEAEEFAEELPAEHTSPAPAALSFSAPAAPSGAASAPAPAKQKVAVKAVARSKPAVAAPKAPAPVAHTETKSAHAPSKLVISAPVAEEPAHVPAFASAHAAPAENKSGNNIALIAAVVVIVLGAAGYFGWSKMHSAATVASVQQSVEKPATPSQVAPAATQPVTPKPSAGVSETQTTHPEAIAENSKPQTEAEKKTSKTPSASAKENDEASDTVTSEEPAARQPLIIKGGGAKTAQGPIATPVAPDPLVASAGSGGKDIAAIAASGADVARPVQQSLRISQGVLQGRLVKKVQPVYPANALRMRTQGTVEIAATISKTGEVTNVKQVSGDQTLGRAAETAVRQWKYKPYMLDGRPVEIQTQISVEFKLPG